MEMSCLNLESNDSPFYWEVDFLSLDLQNRVTMSQQSFRLLGERSDEYNPTSDGLGFEFQRAFLANGIHHQGHEGTQRKAIEDHLAYRNCISRKNISPVSQPELSRMVWLLHRQCVRSPSRA